MLVLVAIAAGLGAYVGLVAGFAKNSPMVDVRYYAYPLPHCVPKYPDGISLRFAMIHDVLHERYTRHGEPYFRERNRRVRESLRQIETEQGPNPTSNEYFALFDDLGAGLDALKEDDEAVRILRDKLRRQEALGQSGRQLYTSYANLGTFLIHGSFQKAVAGDSEAKARVRQGIQFIAQSIEVNPEAHFGREIWQKRSAEFLLEAIQTPETLLQRDFVGNSLPEEIDASGRDSITNYQNDGFGVDAYFTFGWDRMTPPIIEGRKPIESQFGREGLRKWITRVGDPSIVPFDEPTLGIIGMWRLGGGANPHFALALGEIMLRIGQRNIAWSAYERATHLANRFWPDAALQGKFMEHCRRRQEVIEQQIPDEERTKLRPRFDAELAYGQRHQESYQAYEAAQIAEGASIDDEHFYDGFFAEREPIASPVGDADLTVVTHGTEEYTRSWPASVLLAGLAAFLTACAYRLIARLARRPTPKPN
jgi:hypothetical protein